MSDRGILRYGGLDEAQKILDERPPANMDEVRAVLLNLIDHARATDREVRQLWDLLGKAGVIQQ